MRFSHQLTGQMDHRVDRSESNKTETKTEQNRTETSQIEIRPGRSPIGQGLFRSMLSVAKLSDLQLVFHFRF
jgi:hypothetical protein